MATEKQRAKRRARRAHMKDGVEKFKEVQEEIVPDDELILPDEPEPVEKDMGMMGDMYMGPTSWDEYDQMEAAREQAEQVQEVTWNTQDLVRNILWSPMMDAKAKAKAIQAVGAGIEERLGKVETVKKDLDILVIESILAYDRRHAGPLEFIGDWVSKAKLTAAAENALSDEQFALVVTRDGKKIRKYPIHDKAHVRNALARAAQMMAEGGEAAADARAAMPKIRAAAKRMGIETSMEKDRNAIWVEKDAKGDWRWIGWVSNNFIDWDGDIFCEAAHKEYVEWIDKNMDFSPVSIPWHSPFPRENSVDYAAYENGFLIMSGKLTENEAEGLLKAKALVDLGMSHGTFVLSRDPNDPRVITKYRMYEVSDLPLDKAANPFTNFEVLTKEAEMDKLDYLATILGNKEKAEAFLQKTGLKKEALTAAGVESKEKAEETPVPPAAPETTPAPASAAPAAPAVDMEAILKAVGEKYGMEQLGVAFQEIMDASEKVPVLEELVKDLQAKLDEQQGNLDEKLAEKISPNIAKFPWMEKARASQDKANAPTPAEKEKLEKAKPGVPEDYWLSQVTGTTPVSAQ